MHIIYLVFKLSLLFTFTLSFHALNAQDLRVVTRLPEIINESSGIEITGENEIWSFNDSGGAAELYQCDTLGNLVSTVTISPGTNVDWEELTKDEEGNLYIGEFGNNANARTNLKIYKVSLPFNSPDIEPEVISFRYEDQTSFPPNELRFDCEAMIWYQGYIYLFTKHRNLPMATNLYKIPDQAGDYVAVKLGSFLTGEPMEDEQALFDYWVTAADISPDNKRLALLSSNKVWIFTEFDNDNFFEGNVEQINLGHSTQKEGICFRNNTELYITDEYWSSNDVGRNLYLLKLDNMVSTDIAEIQNRKKVVFFPNPFSNMLYVKDNLNIEKLYVTNNEGTVVKEISTTTNRIDLSPYQDGLYHLVYYINDKWETEKILKLE